MDQMDRDVKSTHPDIHFFFGDPASAKANQQLDNSAQCCRHPFNNLNAVIILKEHDEELWQHLEITTEETLLWVCCAMLIHVGRHLLAGDFTTNLKLYSKVINRQISVICSMSPTNRLFHSTR